MAPDTQNRLASVLDRQIAVAMELASLLDAERTALAGSAADQVARRATEKVALLQSMEQLEMERNQLCEGEFASGESTIENRRRWGSLMSIAKACRDANEVNGYIINARNHQVRQMIDILRGGASVTYGPQGKTTANALRALAQA